MTARVITESYDGTSIAVDVTTVMGRSYVSVNTHEFDTDVDAVDADRDTLVYLTAAETTELASALIAALLELITTDTRSPAPPVTGDRGAGHDGPSAAVPGSTTHLHTEGREDCTHVIPQCCTACHDDENARAVAAFLAGARAELLANSTPVGGDR